MKPKALKDKEIIIKYGDFGEEYFILEKGMIEITVYK
jgi:hypothetical protein